MELVNQTLIMVFLGVVAASTVIFPILYLVQKNKQHKELLKVIQNNINIKSSDDN